MSRFKAPLVSAVLILLAGLILKKETVAFQLHDTYYVISYFTISIFIALVIIGLGLMRKRPAGNKS